MDAVLIFRGQPNAPISQGVTSMYLCSRIDAWWPKSLYLSCLPTAVEAGLSLDDRFWLSLLGGRLSCSSLLFLYFGIVVCLQ